MAQQRLKEAAEAEDINGLYSCIKEDPHILDLIDNIPFVDTPLHTAASAGHHLFALEMLRLKPSFGRKLNPDGLSPLDLALRNGHYGTVIRLINIDVELIRVNGREGLTPLHYLAETNQIHLLAEFLCVCPASIEDQTIRAETALHIAVKNFMPEAFKVLLGWLHRTYRKYMLDLEDDEGNNVLHIAVFTSQPQIVKLLVERTRMNKNAKNREGLTALDIVATLGPGTAKIEIENILRGARVLESSSLPNNNNNNNIYSQADFLMSTQGFLEPAVGFIFLVRRRLSLEKSYINMVLVVAVLLATATYQAVLSPPGGVIDHNNAANNNLLPTNVTIMFTTATNLPVPGGGNISSHIINATICTTSTTSDNPHDRVLFRNHKGKPIEYYEDNFDLFYMLNTTTFMFSIIIIIVILLLRPFGLLFQLPLSLLSMSYGLSLVFISPSYSYALSSTCACLAFSYLIPISFYLVSYLETKRLGMLRRCFMNHN